MEIVVLLFLSSGLFLGWSLGSNDAANIFVTVVGSRMITFVTAALICAVFVVLGAVIGGAGTAHGLGKLGAVNALAGRHFAHKWQLRVALRELSEDWKPRDPSPLTKEYNKKLAEMYDYLFRHLYREEE